MADLLKKVFGGPFRRWIDMGDGTHAPQHIAHPPLDLITGTDRPRLRVDPAQTGFFEGREFRIFRRISIPTTEELIIKAETPIDLILFRLQLTLTSGQAEVVTEVGGTEGGTFTDGPTVIGRNTMIDRPTPYYESQITITEGGTLTGSTELDAVPIKAADNSNFSGTVGGSQGDERGVQPGTYYFRIKNTDGSTATGVLNAWWEERP